ncbi:hypothetical protein [Komagataeibacter xylinus]|uniref:hypothetical protein n=1 Tax=Komagataeibacter xylinus TaxID=28448 RepID=UPI0013EA11E7|nr:hypothetical protein [Komagataeibacter xylinus]GBQ70315.1 hypothetical protein AA15237_0840 [Komagataeibacter xylinus NBRC 15237]
MVFPSPAILAFKGGKPPDRATVAYENGAALRQQACGAHLAHAHAAAMAVLEGRMFHPVPVRVFGAALADSLLAEKTLDSQHAKQQRDAKALACMVDEVTHNGLLHFACQLHTDASFTPAEVKTPISLFTIWN